MQIDKGKLGAPLRYQRVSAGYMNADEYADAILKRTRVDISKETIYGVESGKREPKITVFAAMCLTATGNIDWKLIDQCIVERDGTEKWAPPNDCPPRQGVPTAQMRRASRPATSRRVYHAHHRYRQFFIAADYNNSTL